MSEYQIRKVGDRARRPRNNRSEYQKFHVSQNDWIIRLVIIAGHCFSETFTFHYVFRLCFRQRELFIARLQCQFTGIGADDYNPP